MVDGRICKKKHLKIHSKKGHLTEIYNIFNIKAMKNVEKRTLKSTVKGEKRSGMWFLKRIVSSLHQVLTGPTFKPKNDVKVVEKL